MSDIDNEITAKFVDLFDSAMATGGTGYGDGAQHQYLKDSNDVISATTLSNPDPLEPDTTATQPRDGLRAKLAQDSASYLVTSGEQAQRALEDDTLGELPDVRMDRRIKAEAFVAGATGAAAKDPLRTASVATVQALAPGATPQAQMALELQDYMRATVAARFDDASTLGLVADFGAIMFPMRQWVGAIKASDKLPEKYFQALRTWGNMTVAERNAAWDATEKAIWDASGDNRMVYSSLIAPFLNPEDEIWTKVDLTLDAVSSALTVEAVANVWKLVGDVRRGYKSAAEAAASLRLRRRALEAENAKVAGDATVRDIAKGDLSAVVDGGPVKVADDVINGATDGLEGPTTASFIDRMIAKGRLLPGQDVVATVNPMTPELTTAFVERARSAILKGGKIVGETVDPSNLKVTFEVERLVAPQVSVSELRANELAATTRLKAAKGELKALIKSSPAGTNPDQVAALKSEIDALNGKAKDIRKTLRKVGRYEKKTGLKIKSFSDDSASRPVRETVTLNMTVDDAGAFEFKDDSISFLGYLQGTPETRVGNLERGLVSTGQLMRQQQRALFGELEQSVRAVRKKLRTGMFRRWTNTDEGVLVDAVSLTGDRFGKVFGDEELRAGVEIDGVGFARLNERQITAYKELRQVFDDYHYIANRMRVKALTFEGHSQFHVKLYHSDGTLAKVVPVYGKAGAEHIRYSIPTVGDTRTNIVHAIDARTGDVVDLKSLPTLEGELNRGTKGFVELKEPFINGDGKEYNHLLVDVTSIGDLKRVKQAREITHALPYNVGYVPRLSAEPIKYVVETPRQILRDGVEIRETTIDRAFLSRTEAEIYREQLIQRRKEARVAKGLTTEGIEDEVILSEINNRWRALPKNKTKSEFLDGQLFGGAFMGNRLAKNFLKVGLEGRPVERVSSFEAAKRYADFVASAYPMAEFKAAFIKKFLDYARDSEEKSLLQIAHDWTSPIVATGDAKYRNAKALQEYMAATFAVPTTEELTFAKHADQLGQSLEKLMWNKATGTKKGPLVQALVGAPSRALLGSKWARQPFTALKSLTFDAMLGAFNPIQYVVQSSGMFIPASLHPITAAKVMPEFFALRSLFRFSGEGEGLTTTVKAMGLNSERFKTLLHAFHRSGTADSVLENAEFGHYVGSHGAYYSPSLLHSLRDKSRVFYNMGELNNRTFAFTMAFDRKVSEHGWDISKRLTDAQIKEVQQEAYRIGINFGAGNKARWQDGAMGIPTQFMQVSHKYLENMMHGLLQNSRGKENQWTRTETMASLLNGMLLWGYAGIGIDEIFPQFDAWLLDKKDGLGLDPKADRALIAGLRGGFLEMFALKATGIWPDISDRTAPLSQVAQVYNDILVPLAKTALGKGDQGEFVKFLMGASGAMGTRIMRAYAKVLQDLDTNVRLGELHVEDITQTILDAASPISTFSNFSKFRMWLAAGRKVDAEGRDLGINDAGDPVSNTELWARLMGLDTIDVEFQRGLADRASDREQDRRDMAKAVAAEYRKIFTSEGGIADPIIIRQANRNIKVYLMGMSAHDRALVTAQAREMLDDPYKGDKMIQKMIEEYMNSDPGSELEQRLEQEMQVYELMKGSTSSAE